MDFQEIDRLHRQGLALGRQGVMGLLVVGADGRIFAQRRSPTRKTFPGCWDLVGGHIESGETPRQALVRELKEETGWDFKDLLDLRKVVDWETPGIDGKPVLKREFVVAVTISGPADHFNLEDGKVTEGRWFGPGDLNILNENQPGTDSYVYGLAKDWFSDAH